MIREEGAFRQHLVELVAFSTPFGRKVAWEGTQEGLAERLGVSESLLADAAALLRAGFSPRSDGEALLVEVDVQVPAVLHAELTRVAALARMKPTMFLRSLLHALMQGTLEPQGSAVRSWPDLLGPGAVARKHVSINMTRGLAEALERRAAARGEKRNGYILLWLLELSLMRLRDVVVSPVRVAQLFDDPRAYVLPVVKEPWDVEPASAKKRKVIAPRTLRRRRERVRET